MLFTILNNPEMNILKNLPEPVWKEVRKGVIRCILGTDMAKHGEIIALFKKCIDNFNYDDPEHKALVILFNLFLGISIFFSVNASYCKVCRHIKRG